MKPHDIKAHLSNKGVSQTKLANSLRVSPTTVNAVIFKRTTNRRVAEAISQVIGKPVSVIWPGVYEKTTELSVLTAEESKFILNSVFGTDQGSDANTYCELRNLFGLSVAQQTPVHLLGALLFATNDYCDYSEDFNPYPPSSPHHAGVGTGWRMAQAAMSGAAAPLPGTP